MSPLRNADFDCACGHRMHEHNSLHADQPCIVCSCVHFRLSPPDEAASSALLDEGEGEGARTVNRTLRSVNRSEDVKPYTLGEFPIRANAEQIRLHHDYSCVAPVGRECTCNVGPDREMIRRLYETARAGLEDRERLVDAAQRTAASLRWWVQYGVDDAEMANCAGQLEALSGVRSTPSEGSQS